MNPRQFLLWGGAILVVVGLLGFTGVIGPTPQQSIFGSAWWFDNGENWAHLLIGLVGIAAAYTLENNVNRPLTIGLGVIGVLFGLYSAIIGPTFLGANLENPADTILHFAVGAWALFAGLYNYQGGRGRVEMPTQDTSQTRRDTRRSA